MIKLCADCHWSGKAKPGLNLKFLRHGNTLFCGAPEAIDPVNGDANQTCARMREWDHYCGREKARWFADGRRPSCTGMSVTFEEWWESRGAVTHYGVKAAAEAAWNDSRAHSAKAIAELKCQLYELQEKYEDLVPEMKEERE